MLARGGNPNGEAALLKLLSNADTADIVRASALSELANAPSQKSVAAAIDALADENPLVQIAALKLAEFLPPRERFDHVGRLLDAPVRAVRHEASRTLADTPTDLLNEKTVSRT